MSNDNNTNWWQDLGGAVTGIADSVLGWVGWDTNKTLNAQNRADNLENIQIARDREDNAVTRRAEDLRNAGLHPTLAAGNAASAQIGTVPKPNVLNAPTPGHSIVQNALMAQQVAQSRAQVALTNAEAERIRTETRLLDPRYKLQEMQTKGQLGRWDAQNEEIAQQLLNMRATEVWQNMQNELLYRYGVSEKESEILVKKTTALLLEAKEKGQNISNALLQKELDLYEYRFGSEVLDQLFKIAMPIVREILWKHH